MRTSNANTDFTPFLTTNFTGRRGNAEAADAVCLPVLVAELLCPSSEYWQGYCKGSSAPGKYCSKSKSQFKMPLVQVNPVTWTQEHMCITALVQGAPEGHSSAFPPACTDKEWLLFWTRQRCGSAPSGKWAVDNAMFWHKHRRQEGKLSRGAHRIEG